MYLCLQCSIFISLAKKQLQENVNGHIRSLVDTTENDRGNMEMNKHHTSSIILLKMWPCESNTVYSRTLLEMSTNLLCFQSKRKFTYGLHLLLLTFFFFSHLIHVLILSYYCDLALWTFWGTLSGLSTVLYQEHS